MITSKAASRDLANLSFAKICSKKRTMASGVLKSVRNCRRPGSTRNLYIAARPIRPRDQVQTPLRNEPPRRPCDRNSASTLNLARPLPDFGGRYSADKDGRFRWVMPPTPTSGQPDLDRITFLFAA